MNKKILFFINGSYVSGLENVMLHLLSGLKEKDYNIQCIISGWNDGNLRQQLETLGIINHEVKIGWIHFSKPVWTIDTLINYPKAYFTCKKIIRDFKPDILNFANYFMPVMLYSLIKHKSVYNLHETHLPTKKHLWIYNLLNKKVDVFTAVSKHISKTLEQLNIPVSKIKVVYNGIPPLKIEHNTNFTAGNTNLSFAMVGQIRENKGHITLIDATEILVNKGIKNFKVHIFGNAVTTLAGKLKEIINKKNLEPYFVWNGFVHNQDEIYNNCDVVVVPSFAQEACSLTIIEAMARGKALIVSERGANSELIKHEESGLIFQTGDPLKLSESMLKLIADKNIIINLGANAKKLALSDFTSQLMVDEYSKIYEEILKFP